MGFNIPQARELANAMNLEIWKSPEGWYVTSRYGKTKKSPVCPSLDNLKYWLDGYAMRATEDRNEVRSVQEES